MSFTFTEVQNTYRREVRRFVEKEMAPVATGLAKLNYLPIEVRRKIAEGGFYGINMPEKYGGQPADWVSMGIAVEEFSRLNIMLGPHLTHIIGTSLFLLSHGSEEIKETWLRGLISGKIMVCHALTEPGCGSDAAAIKIKAERRDDVYVLNGEKTSVTLGMQSDIALVFAKTDAEAGVRGVTAFIVPLELPGISRSAFDDLGWHWAGRASIFFDDVEVPAKFRLGKEGQGFYITMGQFDFMRIGLSLGCISSAQVSIEEAVNFARQRMAFGRPLAKFEGISFKIAEHATILEAARLLCYHAFSLKDQGMDHIKESAMCKWWCPKIAVEAIHDAMLIHGHVGYTREYPLEGRLRDAIGFETGDGTAEIMKIIIAREIIGADFLPY
ncbi:MAG: acyl-CoA dehydrogenase family protein [Dehalococcoidia bacterium]|nr:acyl-CoA dehydrogenase family protein [Dehalococcoidia bacterium]